MKVKNLFKSLAIVALIVPFMFGLAACGKKKTDKRIDASVAYEAIINYVAEQQAQSAPTNKMTVVSTFKDNEGPVQKTILGYDESGDPAVNNYFIEEYDDDVLTSREFTAGEGQAKKVYKFETDAWQTPTEFDNSQYQTYISQYKMNALQAMMLLTEGDYLPSDTTVDFTTYGQTLSDSIEAEGTVKVSFDGMQYKDGSIGFIINVSVEDEVEEVLNATKSKIEIVVKNNKLVRATLDTKSYEDGELTDSQFYESVIVEEFLTEHIPANPETECVPVEE